MFDSYKTNSFNQKNILMKKLSILLVFFAIVMFSCEEIVAPIDLELRYTGRRVIVEEFTGVQCVNCPEGSKRLQELDSLHGEYLIPISIHAGSFSEPYNNESLYDFRVPQGENLESNLLGPVQGFPAATVNRRVFPDESELPIVKNKWAGYIVQELLKTPELEVDITNDYDATTRQLEIEVELDFAVAITEPLGISIMILEDDIKDYQLTKESNLYPGGKNPNYNHKYVLRTMLTDYTGDAISSTKTKQGSKPTFNYTFTLPTEWNSAKCEVVAFVSHKGDKLDVLQANAVDVE